MQIYGFFIELQNFSGLNCHIFSHYCLIFLKELNLQYETFPFYFHSTIL